MNPSGAPQKHLCFYSNKCKYSEAFLKQLKETAFKTQFDYVCVDGRVGELTQRYKWLKRTPTLVIRGEADPREFNEAMNWLSEQKVLQGGKTAAGPNGQPAAAPEPEPWVGTEMGGALTKGFSFLGANDTNEAPMGNFEFLNGQSAVGVKTASDYPNGGMGARAQKSNKESMFDKQMEDFMRTRNSGMPQAPMRQ
jgi:hypothetical protein